MSGPWYQTATLQVSDFKWDWCSRCCCMSLQCGDILAVTPDGVQRVGGVAVCAECGYSPHAQEPRAAS